MTSGLENSLGTGLPSLMSLRSMVPDRRSREPPSYSPSSEILALLSWGHVFIEAMVPQS